MPTNKRGAAKKSTPTAKQTEAPKVGDKEKAVMIGARVHPKLQYGLRLLSRVQGGTIAEALEWAINLAMRNTGIGAGAETVRLNRVVDKVWEQPSIPRRIYTLFESAPELLDFDERGAWNLVRRCDDLWSGQYYTREEGGEDEHGLPTYGYVMVEKDDPARDRDLDNVKPRFDVIEEHWKVIAQTGVLLARAGEIGNFYTLDQITSGEALKIAGIETPY